jgi:peptide chain release factor 2
LREQYEDLRTRSWNSSGGFFDVPIKRAELEKIEAQASAPDFWSNQEAAQKLLQRRSRLQHTIERQEKFETEVSDAGVLFEFAAEDDSSAAELRESLARLAHDVEENEVAMLLGGENDRRNAIVSINAGAGGTDAQDWAQMLHRMYLRWAERQGFRIEEIDYQPGEEAGIKSATFRVEGQFAYGLLSGEAGSIVLCASPFNAGQSRERASLRCLSTPRLMKRIEIEVQEKDRGRYISIDPTPEGSTSIRLTPPCGSLHLPTNIVVTSKPALTASEPDVAMRVLKSRLAELELEKKQAETNRLAASKRDISFGSQIRNYVASIPGWSKM